MTDERWLPIPGFGGHYEVSDQGRVRSLDRYVSGPIKPGQRRSHKGQVLRSKRLNQPEGRLSEHRIVTLCVDGVRHPALVHALVMLAFVGPRPDGMQIRHRNGDGTDNRLSNLQYGTASENTLDMVDHGVHNHARKTHCKRGHPFDEANTIVRGERHRECRTCRNLTNRRYYERAMMRAANLPDKVTTP